MAKLNDTTVYGDLTVTGNITNAFVKLAEVSGINLKTVGNTILYTVGSTANVIVLRIDLLCTTATAANGNAIISLGTNATDYDNIQAEIQTVGLNAANKVFSINIEGIQTKANNTTIRLNVTGAETGTANTVTAILWGYEY